MTNNKSEVLQKKIIGNWVGNPDVPKWKQLRGIGKFYLLKILVGKDGIVMNIATGLDSRPSVPHALVPKGI